MARTAKSPISPIEAQLRAMEFLRRIGCPVGPWQKFTDKPIRVRGKNRKGQHRGHRCSRTGGSKKKKGGN